MCHKLRKKIVFIAKLVKNSINPVAKSRILPTRRNLNNNEKASDSEAKNPRGRGEGF